MRIYSDFFYCGLSLALTRADQMPDAAQFGKIQIYFLLDENSHAARQTKSTCLIPYLLSLKVETTPQMIAEKSV